MISLVLVYCLAKDPLSCIEQRPMLEEGLESPMACMVSGQLVASEFVREHPNYRLSAWRCEVNHRTEEQA